MKAMVIWASAYGIRHARFWILNSGFLDSAQKWSLALITLATFLPQAQNLALEVSTLAILSTIRSKANPNHPQP